MQCSNYWKTISVPLFFYWAFESEENAIIFIIKALSGESVITLKQLFEMVKEKDYPVVAAISKPYKGIEGIKKVTMRRQNYLNWHVCREPVHLQCRKSWRKMLRKHTLRIMKP